MPEKIRPLISSRPLEQKRNLSLYEIVLYILASEFLAVAVAPLLSFKKLHSYLYNYFQKLQIYKY